MQKFANRDG
jgi:hypothetical protein